MEGFKSFAKKNWFGLVSLGVSLIILCIFSFVTGGWREFFKSVAGMNIYWLAAMIICTFLFWLTDGFILHRYILLKYKTHSFIKTMKTTVIGLLYNCLTPFASGGQPMQVYDMVKDGVDAGDAALYVTVKSLIYQICLTVYTIAAVCFAMSFFRSEIPHFLWFLSLGMTVNTVYVAAVLSIIINKNIATRLGMFFVKILSKMKIIKNYEKSAENLNKQIILFHNSYRQISQKKGELIFSFIATFIQLTLYYCLPYLIFRGFNLSEGSFALIVSAQAILMLITAFVPIPGSSGVVEAGFYVFFEIFFTPETIMPAMFVWRVLTYYLCILAGGTVSVFGMKRKK